MSSTPLISVIIPAYKHRDHIIATLKSVYAQTFTDFEVIVVNDGSPDDTRDVLKPEIQSGRIRYIEQENQGQSSARNRGLAEARGSLIAFIDDDDVWPNDKLEWQAAALIDAPNAVLVYGGMRVLGEEKSLLFPEGGGPSSDVHNVILSQNFICSPGQVLIRRSALEACGGFDALLWGVDDWDLYIRLAAQGEFSYQHRDALYYRVHSGNASSDGWRMFVNGMKMRRKHFGKIPPLTRWKQYLLSRWFVGKYSAPSVLSAARAAVKAGDSAQARLHWLRLMYMTPQAFRRYPLFVEAIHALGPFHGR